MWKFVLANIVYAGHLLIYKYEFYYLLYQSSKSVLKGMSLAALFAMISNKWVVMSDYDQFHGGKTKNSMGIWVSYRHCC